jgi:hypothetical protein
MPLLTLARKIGHIHVLYGHIYFYLKKNLGFKVISLSGDRLHTNFKIVHQFTENLYFFKDGSDSLKFTENL